MPKLATSFDPSNPTIGSAGGAHAARCGSCGLFAVHVMHDNAGAGRRHGQPLLALERAFGVFVTALPVLAHRRPGKFVVLGVSLVGFLLIDDVQN